MKYLENLEYFRHLAHAVPLTLEASERLWTILEATLRKHPKWKRYVVNNCP